MGCSQGHCHRGKTLDEIPGWDEFLNLISVWFQHPHSGSCFVPLGRNFYHISFRCFFCGEPRTVILLMIQQQQQQKKNNLQKTYSQLSKMCTPARCHAQQHFHASSLFCCFSEDVLHASSLIMFFLHFSLSLPPPLSRSLSLEPSHEKATKGEAVVVYYWDSTSKTWTLAGYEKKKKKKRGGAAPAKRGGGRAGGGVWRVTVYFIICRQLLPVNPPVLQSASKGRKGNHHKPWSHRSDKEATVRCHMEHGQYARQLDEYDYPLVWLKTKQK